VTAAFRIDQLSRDADTLTIALDAAFEQIPDPELLPHQANVDHLPLVLKARIARDHQQVREFR